MTNHLPPLRILATSLLLSVWLAACGGQSPRPTSGGYGQTGNAASTTKHPPNAPKLPENQEITDAARFKGLATSDVLSALGNPDFRRREKPAEIWQYYGDSCVLDLFFYEETKGQRVTFAELRSRSPSPANSAKCLTEMLDGKRGQPSD